MNNRIFASVLILFFLLSCDSDSVIPSTEDMADTSLQLLTGGTSKTWRIESATLTNNGNTIDISQNFNVKDDEFVFTKDNENAILLWKKNDAINTSANTAEEAVMDLYLSAVEHDISFQENSTTIMKSNFGNYVFEINAENTISAIIPNEDGTVLNLELSEKLAQDYATFSNNFQLNFSEVLTFESNGIARSSAGFVGSNANNNLYVCMREDQEMQVGPERLVKFDLDNGSVTENLFTQQDFFSKQLHVIGDKLVVVAGSHINTYSMNTITSGPVSVEHGEFISRPGTAVVNDDIYILGGNLQENNAFNVFKWNTTSDQLSLFTTLPEVKVGARSSIVGGNLYAFGGGDDLMGNNSTDTIYEINLANPGQVQTYQMNEAMNFTYVQRFQNLIFVAGEILTQNTDGVVIGRTSAFGVFNTLDKTYQELNTNLSNPNNSESVKGMTIIDDKMYIIYGEEGSWSSNPVVEWKIMVSELPN